MTIGENQLEPAEITAPEQDTTAVPGSVETETPETPEVEKAPKSFTQEELDKIVAKEKAKAQRKAEREVAARFAQQQPQQPVSDEPIVPEQFETYEDYAEALAVRKAQELIQQRETQQRQSKVDQAFDERVTDAMDKYDDFEQVAFNPALFVSNAMAETIKESELGPDLLYYLGSNPKEAERIFQLTPLQQAREIGKIEVKIAADPPVKKTTSAPAPINPVNARQSTNPSYDTTDPRSTKTMSTSEWIEAENQRVMRKMQQNR